MNNRYGERFNPTGFKFFQISRFAYENQVNKQKQVRDNKDGIWDYSVHYISPLCYILLCIPEKLFEIGQIPSAYGSTFVVIKIDSFIIVISYVEKAYYTWPVRTCKIGLWEAYLFNFLHISAAFKLIVNSSYYSVLVFWFDINNFR